MRDCVCVYVCVSVGVHLHGCEAVSGYMYVGGYIYWCVCLCQGACGRMCMAMKLSLCAGVCGAACMWGACVGCV